MSFSLSILSRYCRAKSKNSKQPNETEEKPHDVKCNARRYMHQLQFWFLWQRWSKIDREDRISAARPKIRTTVFHCGYQSAKLASTTVRKAQSQRGRERLCASRACICAITRWACTRVRKQASKQTNKHACAPGDCVGVYNPAIHPLAHTPSRCARRIRSLGGIHVVVVAYSSSRGGRKGNGSPEDTNWLVSRWELRSYRHNEANSDESETHPPVRAKRVDRQIRSRHCYIIATGHIRLMT